MWDIETAQASPLSGVAHVPTIVGFWRQSLDFRPDVMANIPIQVRPPFVCASRTIVETASLTSTRKLTVDSPCAALDGT